MIGFLVRGRGRIKIRFRPGLGLGLGLRLTLSFIFGAIVAGAKINVVQSHELLQLLNTESYSEGLL